MFAIYMYIIHALIYMLTYILAYTRKVHTQTKDSYIHVKYATMPTCMYMRAYDKF